MKSRTVSLADAKARLSELAERAESGDDVIITRRGKPVACLTTARPERKRVDIEALKGLTSQMPPQRESAGRFIRRLREDARY
jgi:prevent-host-death family protein